jgi:hypothetical protein
MSFRYSDLEVIPIRFEYSAYAAGNLYILVQ